MSASSKALRKIFDEARPLVEQALDLSDKFKGFRELATANGLDWSQIKALLKAQIQDEREDEGKNRVGRIIEKADFATAYADMLGLGAAKMNENNFSSELHKRHDGVVVSVEAVMAVLPPHDEDGVIIETAIAPAPGAKGLSLNGDVAGASGRFGGDASPTNSEPASAPSDAEAGQGEGLERAADLQSGFEPSSVASPTVLDIGIPISDDVPGNGPATAPAPGAGGLTSAKGDAEENEDPGVLPSWDASPTNSAAGAAEQGLGTAPKSMPGPDLSQSVALALPVVTDAPEAPASPMPVEASGDPIPCEANGWAGLEPLPQFDRRRISEAAA